MNAPSLATGSSAASTIRWLVGTSPDAPTASEWVDVLPLVRRLGLGGRLASRVRDTQLVVHPTVRDHLEAARRIAAKHETSLRWETHRVSVALSGLDVPVILLKGAAYQARGLPAAIGRYSSDIDIMVPRDRLIDVERALMLAGWRSAQPDEYDQRYFRQWMHELPPLRHELRNTVLDLHHTILPPTSRFNRNLDPGLLFAAAVPAGVPGITTLCNEDMVLHSAAHRFSEGEHAFALRDLIDVHELLDHFARCDSDFWERLVQRAEELSLERPLFYALRYCRWFLGTHLPGGTLIAIERLGPGPVARRAMDFVVARSFLPNGGLMNTFSDWLLYCRGHYLRMPWRLLIPHLARKWTSRRQAEEQRS